jgi:hypothetical protein
MQQSATLQADIAQYVTQIRNEDSLYTINGNAQHLAQFLFYKIVLVQKPHKKT